MKKIIIPVIIILLLGFVSALEIIEHTPNTVNVSLYEYLNDKNIRTQYHKYKICKKLTNKNDCLDKPLCTWEKSLGIGDYTPEPYCVNKDYGDYTRIKNMSREFQKEQDNLSENFKESLL